MSAADADKVRSCVEERPHVGLAERGPAIWHAASAPHLTDWDAILCGHDPDEPEGIVYGGYPEQRVPTCADCRALLSKHRSVAAAKRAIEAAPSSPEGEKR